MPKVWWSVCSNVTHGNSVELAQVKTKADREKYRVFIFLIVARSIHILNHYPPA